MKSLLDAERYIGIDRDIEPSPMLLGTMGSIWFPTIWRYPGSFNGTLRDECLNTHWFTTLADAKEQIERWRTEYNESRPHRALGEIPPAEFARQLGVYTQLTGLSEADD
jgi:putative transposase